MGWYTMKIFNLLSAWFWFNRENKRDNQWLVNENKILKTSTQEVSWMTAHIHFWFILQFISIIIVSKIDPEQIDTAS